MKTFPIVKDLVTDVKWNYEVNKKIAPFTPKQNAEWRWKQEDIDRVQEFRKCIECFLCQDVCHVLRSHARTDAFAGPRFLVRVAGLEMHPMDARKPLEIPETRRGDRVLQQSRSAAPRSARGESRFTDNAIIPLKETRGRRPLRSGPEAFPAS